MKPRLKQFYILDYTELNELVKQTIGREYDCIKVEEWSNDSSHTFYVRKDIDTYSFSRVNEYKLTGEFSPLVAFVLDYLAFKEIIPEGNYIIMVSW